MKPLAEVEKEIANYGKVSLWGVKKEIKNLSTKLDKDEKVVGLVRVFTSATIALLVATDRRLILMDNHMVYGTDHKDFAYMTISGVDYNTRLIFGKIVIEDQTGKNYFDYALKNDLRKFMKVLAAKMSEYRDKVINRGGKKNVADEIEKLWNLVEKGAITQEEYEARKIRLLES